MFLFTTLKQKVTSNIDIYLFLPLHDASAMAQIILIETKKESAIKSRKDLLNSEQQCTLYR
jgi:hypothetical protein